MWGQPQLGRWKNHTANVHAQLLVDNNTRLWIFSPATLTASNPAAMIGYPDIAQGTNRTFFAQYHNVGGSNAHFDLPVSGDHGWSTWAPQLAAMSDDLAGSIR
jgi:S-formylglutathione hydrolase FrmB